GPWNRDLAPGQPPLATTLASRPHPRARDPDLAARAPPDPDHGRVRPPLRRGGERDAQRDRGAPPPGRRVRAGDLSAHSESEGRRGGPTDRLQPGHGARDVDYRQ